MERRPSAASLRNGKSLLAAPSASVPDVPDSRHSPIALGGLDRSRKSEISSLPDIKGTVSEERAALSRSRSCSTIEGWGGSTSYPSARTISCPAAPCVKPDTLVTEPPETGHTLPRNAVLSTRAVEVGSTRSNGNHGQRGDVGGSGGGTPRGAVHGPSTPDREQEGERKDDAGCADADESAREQRNRIYHSVHSNDVNSGGGSSTFVAGCILIDTREAGVKAASGNQNPKNHLAGGGQSGRHDNQDHVQTMHRRAPTEATPSPTRAAEFCVDGAAAATTLTPPPAPLMAAEQLQPGHQSLRQRPPGAATGCDRTDEPTSSSTTLAQVVASSSLCRASSGTVSRVVLAARVASLDAILRNAARCTAIQLRRTTSASRELLTRSTSTFPPAASKPAAAAKGDASCASEGGDGNGELAVYPTDNPGAEVRYVSATLGLASAAAAAAAAPSDSTQGSEFVGPVERHAASRVPVSPEKSSVLITRLEPQTPVVTGAEAAAGCVQLPLARWDRYSGAGRSTNLSSFLEGLDLEIQAAVTAVTEAAAAAASTSTPCTTATAATEMAEGASGGGAGSEDLPLPEGTLVADASGVMDPGHSGTKPPPWLLLLLLQQQEQQQQQQSLPLPLSASRWLRAGDMYGSSSSLGAKVMTDSLSGGWSRVPGSESISLVQDPAPHPQRWSWRPNFHPRPGTPTPAPGASYHPTSGPNDDDTRPPVATATDRAHLCTSRWGVPASFESPGCRSEGGGRAGGCQFAPSVAEASMQLYMAPPPPPPSPSRHNLGHQRHSENMAISFATWQSLPPEPPPPPPPTPPPPFLCLPQSQPQPLQPRTAETGRLCDSLFRLAQRELPFTGAPKHVMERPRTGAGSPRATAVAGAATEPAAPVADQHYGKGLTFAAITAGAAGGGVGDGGGHSAGLESTIKLRPGGSTGGDIVIRAVQHGDVPAARASGVAANPLTGIASGGFTAAAGCGCGSGGCGSNPTSLLDVADSDHILSFAALGMGSKLPLPSALHSAPMTGPPPEQKQLGPFPVGELTGWLDVLMGIAAHDDVGNLERVLEELGYEALTTLMQAAEMMEATADPDSGHTPSAGPPREDLHPSQTLTTAPGPERALAKPPPRIAATRPAADSLVVANHGAGGAAAVGNRASGNSRVAASHLCCQHTTADDRVMAPAAAAATAQVAPGAVADTLAGSGSRPRSAFAAAAGGGDASGGALSIAFPLAAATTTAVAGNSERATARSRNIASGEDSSVLGNGSGRRNANGDDFHAPSSIVPLTLTTARTIRPRKIPHAAASAGSGGAGSEVPAAAAATLGGLAGSCATSTSASATSGADVGAVAPEEGKATRTGGTCSGRPGEVEASVDMKNAETVEVGVSDVTAKAASSRGIPVGAHEASRNLANTPDAASAAASAEVSESAPAVMVSAAAAATGTTPVALAALPSATPLRPIGMALTSPFAQAALQALALDDEVDDSDGKHGAAVGAADASEVQRAAHDSVCSGAQLHSQSSQSVTLGLSAAKHSVATATAVMGGGQVSTVSSPLLPPRASGMLSRSLPSARPQEAVVDAATAPRPGLAFRRTGSGRGPSRTARNGACSVPDLGRRGSAGSTARERQHPAGPRPSHQHQHYPHQAERGGSAGFIDVPHTGATPHPEWGSVPQFVAGGMTLPATTPVEVSGAHGAVPAALPMAATAVRQHSWQLPYQVAQAVLHGPAFPGPLPPPSQPPQSYPHPHPFSQQWGGLFAHILVPAAHGSDVTGTGPNNGGENAVAAISYSADPSGNGAPARSSTTMMDEGAGGVPRLWIMNHGSQDIQQQMIADPTQTFSPLMPLSNPQQLHQPAPWPAAAPLASTCPLPTLIRQASAACPLPPAPLFVPLIIPSQQQQQLPPPPGGAMGIMVYPPAPEPAAAAGVYPGAHSQYLQHFPAWAMPQATVLPYGGPYQAVPYVVEDSRAAVYGASAFSTHGPQCADSTATPTGCLMRGPNDEVYNHPSIMVPPSPTTQQGDSRGDNPLPECPVYNWPGTSSSFSCSSSYSGSGPSGEYSGPPGKNADVWQHPYIDGVATAVARRGSVVTIPDERDSPAMAAAQPRAVARGSGSLVEQQLGHWQQHNSTCHRHCPVSPQKLLASNITPITPTPAPVVGIDRASTMTPPPPGAVPPKETPVREDMDVAAPPRLTVMPKEALYIDRHGSEANTGIAVGHRPETKADDGVAYFLRTEGESLLPSQQSSPSSVGGQKQQYYNNAGGSDHCRGRNRTRPRTKTPPPAVGMGLPSHDTLSTFKWCHVQHSRKQAPALDDGKVRELVRAQLQSRMPIRAPWYRDAATSRLQAQTAAVAALQQRQEQQQDQRPAGDHRAAEVVPKAWGYRTAIGQEAPPTPAAAHDNAGHKSGPGRVKSMRAVRTGVSNVGADVATGTGVFIPSKA